MFSFITLPVDAVTDITASIGTMVTDLWLVIALAIGLPLAFYVIKRVIGLVPKGK
jgi:hypothetical protein